MLLNFIIVLYGFIIIVINICFSRGPSVFRWRTKITGFFLIFLLRFFVNDFNLI